MKWVLFFCASLHAVCARPQSATIIDTVNYTLNESGSFSHSFTTGNGIHHKVEGEIKNVGTPDEGLAVKGTYFYITPEGSIYKVKYVADDKGFRPTIKIATPSRPRTGTSCISTLCGTGLG